VQVEHGENLFHGAGDGVVAEFGALAGFTLAGVLKLGLQTR